jgi:Zn-dependent peptidase ImmA (M78 family)
MKSYLSSNPLMGGSFKKFKLDVVTKEILEIFANYFRVAIERINYMKSMGNVSKRFGKIQENISIVRMNKNDKTPKKP